MKDMLIKAHEELAAEWKWQHPKASWEEAYAATESGAYDRLRENMADQADWFRLRMKEGY